jgi:hypothetical protein
MRRVNIKNLVLRNKIYYFRISFQKSDGKFSSIKKSLGTSDLNLAIQRLELVKKGFLMKVNNVELNTTTPITIEQYLQQIAQTDEERAHIIENEYRNLSDTDVIDKYFKCEEIIRLSKTGNSATLLDRYSAGMAAELEKNKLYILIHHVRAKTNPDIIKRFEKYESLYSPRQITWEQMTGGLQVQPTIFNQYPVQSYKDVQIPKNTIREILTESLVRNSDSIKERFPQTLKNLLEPVGLSLDDDYSKLNDENVIKKIVETLVSRTNLNNDSKNKTMDVLRKVIKQAHKKEPDFYKGEKLLYYLERLPDTPSSEKQKYGAFDNAQLSNMFDPKYDFFKTHPDEFLACLIVLFSGSRNNASITLQYGDFIEQDGIQCMWFRKNHSRKKLKNDASARIVPIPQQLLDWGFVDMIRERQKKIGAQDTDFIFERAATMKKDPAKKFMSPWRRFISDDLGIVQQNGRRYTFHSFRDTVSKYTKQLGIDDSIVDDIIGWEPNSTRSKHYLEYTTQEIKDAADLITYPEDILHLEKWKKIIPNLYINPEKINHKRGKYKPHIKID